MHLHISTEVRTNSAANVTLSNLRGIVHNSKDNLYLPLFGIEYDYLQLSLLHA